MDAKLDLRTLELAAAVAECGSMSEVARRFGLTQSAVSQAVGRVEAMIGARILHRESRPMSATKAGRVLAHELRELSLGFSRALEAARAAADRPELPQLRLGLLDTIAATIGAYLVKELLDGAAALRLSTWSGLAPAHSDALARRAIDAAITCDAMDDVPNLLRHPLFREPYFLLVPKDLAPRLRGVGLRDVLERHRLIRHSARSFMGIQVERHLRRSGLEPAQVLEFDGSDALAAMVAIGVGVAIVTPLCLLQATASAGEVEGLPLPGPSISREIFLVTQRDIGSVGARIARLTRELLQAHALPRIHAMAPWLAQHPDLQVLTDRK